MFWYVNPYPWHDDDRHCLSYADAAIVNYADFKQFISWSSSETKNANDRHESVQIHVRLKLQDLKQDVINDLEQHAEVTALILVCDKLSLPDLVERVLTISRLSALTNLHEPFETLRSLLKIPLALNPICLLIQQLLVPHQRSQHEK
ncbi:hypothetical protein [Candidatus Pantoea bituminis]|uniref:hypothetical protein n=1 Tax=Candidatus Pantoea bituminis TaxID=2831036 RepID=UPI001C061DCD|nr:hypothetical protein [Pantoea bituminis]